MTPDFALVGEGCGQYWQIVRGYRARIGESGDVKCREINTFEVADSNDDKFEKESDEWRWHFDEWLNGYCCASPVQGGGWRLDLTLPRRPPTAPIEFSVICSEVPQRVLRTTRYSIRLSISP